MVIGACRVILDLPENASLKDKRQVLKSVMARVRNQFNVAIAEAGEQDRWRTAELGICCVSTDAQHANSMLSKVVDFIAGSRWDAELAHYEIEIINAF